MSENQQQSDRKKLNNGNSVLIAGIAVILLIAILAIVLFVDHVYGSGTLLFTSGAHN